MRLIAEREKALRDVEARLAALAAAPGALNLETRRLEKEARRRLTDLGKMAVGSLFTIESIPRGTLAMVNMSGYEWLAALTLPLELMA